MERSPAETQGLVYAETPDVLSGRWCCSATTLVDSGGPASGAILRYDRPSRRRAGPTCLGVVTVVTILLCIDPESRDYLLGHGRVLSVVSTGLLLLVLTMTVVGWSLTY